MLRRLLRLRKAPSLPNQLALVRTTVGSRAVAEALARRLVDGRLAACTHVAEVSSVYRWNGERRQETEYLVEARTTPARLDDLVQAMSTGHPYEVPLVESWGVESVPPAYLAWVGKETA